MAEWITTDEASQLSGYHVEYLRDLIRNSKIDAQKKGGRWWVDRRSLLTFIDQSKNQEDKRHGARKKNEAQS